MPQPAEKLEILKRANKGSLAWLMVVDALLLGRIVLRDACTRYSAKLAVEAIILCSPPSSTLAREAWIVSIAAHSKGGVNVWYPLSLRMTLSNFRKAQNRRSA